ncbi:tetratricopeptide repeat protein [Candidatus Symbiobacter mobilis]|uniref:protein O-GlcNAc transferase n=1 Tax=Candidatus Symbiobacter mobilis CR TaxID=946483 RepID=U5NBD4_9BURK|nr:tetratricopeptide repeat protein [Candidatus Symbiobacter mobilis]AGX87484.1 O-linked N-acetylglucosamine transferase-like protein [Candidatus Symbiobacter mobilis CR]
MSRPISRGSDALADRIRAAFDASNWAEAIRLCKATLRKNPLHLPSHRYLGFALYQTGEIDAALAAYGHANILFPDDGKLLLNYANILLHSARFEESKKLLERLCTLRPDDVLVWIRLSQACYPLQQHEKGFAAAQRAVELAVELPDKVAALTQRAIQRRELGQVRAAVLDCEEGITLDPTCECNYTNRLLFMLADPLSTDEDMARAAREYAEQFETPLKPFWPTFADHPRGPWRRLRIGFLSADFRNHAAMYWMEGLLSQLDRRQFEVYAFYMFPKDDWITDRVQCHVDHFIHVDRMLPEVRAQRIQEQGIDILVDLSGHTGNNGLMTVARKPAPVQVNWLGFVSTSGLSAIDYKISCAVQDPEGIDFLYTEKIYRLPVCGCYRPMIRNPLWRYQPRYTVRPTPAMANGYITFGTCNNLGKLTDGVLTLWGQLQQRVAGSWLLIEGKNFDLPAVADAYRERCGRLGIDPQRLQLVPLHQDNQYLTYHQIDIALDPFPLGGGTTTCDVLWMGVPLVTLEGKNAQGRMGVSALTAVGRTEWIAPSTDAYLDIAAELASDVQRLNQIRLGLRGETERSTLMREDFFRHYFGEALRAMWVQWIAQTNHPGDPDAQSSAIESWLQDIPPEWEQPPRPGVGIAPGQRIPLEEAHQRLQQLIADARNAPPPPSLPAPKIEDIRWVAATQFAELVLCAVPHDPVALTCLAEIELAHGYKDFALTYLQYAAQSMSGTSGVMR